MLLRQHLKIATIKKHLEKGNKLNTNSRMWADDDQAITFTKKCVKRSVVFSHFFLQPNKEKETLAVYASQKVFQLHTFPGLRFAREKRCWLL